MTEAIRKARKAGLGIVTMKALAGGLSRIKRGDRLYGTNVGALTGILSQDDGVLAAIKWVLKNESVDTAIVCMADHEQLDTDLRAMAEPYTNKDDGLLAE